MTLLDKLREKLESLESSQITMEAINTYYRKHGTLDGCPDLSEDFINKLKVSMEQDWRKNPKPYERYMLSNNTAEIRRLKKRVEDLERRQEHSGWEFDGGKVVINKAVNRLQIIFDAKPDVDVRTELKRNGFKWSPLQNAWQRQYTDNAMYAIKRISAVTASAQ